MNSELILCLILVLSITVGCVKYVDSESDMYTEKFEKTIQVDGEKEIDVFNTNGAIHVQGWEKDEVEIIAVKKSDRSIDELKKIEISVEVDDEITIETIYKEDNVDASVDYNISVPENGIVSELESSNGSITVNQVKGNMDIETSNGKVEVYDIDGSAEIETSNGSISVEKVTDVVEAESSNGRITIKSCNKVRDIETTNGRIYAEIPKIDGETEVTTTNGSIELYLSDDCDVDFEVETSNGKISIDDFDITSIESDEDYFHGRIGEGTNPLYVETTNGSIEIKKLKK